MGYKTYDGYETLVVEPTYSRDMLPDMIAQIAKCLGSATSRLAAGDLIAAEHNARRAQASLIWLIEQEPPSGPGVADASAEPHSRG